jgi:hypothetical protein
VSLKVKGLQASLGSATFGGGAAGRQIKKELSRHHRRLLRVAEGEGAAGILGVSYLGGRAAGRQKQMRS